MDGVRNFGISGVAARLFPSVFRRFVVAVSNNAQVLDLRCLALAVLGNMVCGYDDQMSTHALSLSLLPLPSIYLLRFFFCQVFLHAFLHWSHEAVWHTWLSCNASWIRCCNETWPLWLGTRLVQLCSPLFLSLALTHTSRTFSLLASPRITTSTILHDNLHNEQVTNGAILALLPPFFWDQILFNKYFGLRRYRRFTDFTIHYDKACSFWCVCVTIVATLLLLCL